MCQIATNLLSSYPALTCFVRITVVAIVYVVNTGLCNKVMDIQGPAFLQEPPDQLDFSNSTGATLVCSAHGTPNPVITWLRSNGLSVDNVDGLRETHVNGTLVFMPFRPENYRQDIHATVYRCKASNAVGTVLSRNVHLRAVVKQYYEVHVYDEFVINGNTAVLKCNIPSFVRDYVTVTSWVRETSDGKRQVIVNGGRYSVHSTGELHIRNVHESDGRLTSYRCMTRHRLIGESKLSTSSGRLIVTDPTSSVPPRITHGKNIVTAQEGDIVELPCAAQGYPLPTYSWRRFDGAHLRPVIVGGHLQLIIGSLLVKNVKSTDASTYVCVVNNTVGEEKFEVELRVSAPVFAYIEPSKQVIDVGKTASFQCSFTGFPVTDVHWLKDGRPLDTSSQQIRYQMRDNLHIASVQREDRGMYQCFVVSGSKTAQGTAELRLGDAKPQLLQTFKSQVLQLGAGFSLRCVASGNPPPQISWTLDDAPIHGSPDRYVMEEQISVHGDVISYVNVSKTRAEDGGEFRCTAANQVGSVDHRQRIDIHGPPFVRAMPNVSAVSGGSLSTRCRVYGHPIRSISWQKDGIVLPINHRQKVFPNGTLLVHDVERSVDAGRYTCVARGAIEDGNPSLETGQARGDVYVTVTDPPKISPFNFPRDIQEGMRASITCSVIHGDQPISMSWLKDGIVIHPNVNVVVRIMDELTSTLVIRQITPKDNGNYTCVAKNSAAIVNWTSQLSVLVPPRWIHEPKDASIVTGKSIILDCEADGQPTPSFIWRRAIGRLPGEYVPIDYSSGRNYMYSNGSLLLTSIQETDQSYYLCQANNSVGAGLSKVIFLKVHAPAYFDEKFRNFTVKRGEQAILGCHSNGDLPISIEWKIQNQRLDLRKKSRFSVRDKATSKGFSSELVITGTGRDDTTEFSCLASNSYGKDQAWIFLIVQEPPEPPHDVKVTIESSRSLKVTWTPSYDGNSPILRFIVQFKVVGVTWTSERRNVSVPGTETSKLVGDLKPAVEYDVVVASENMIGIGTLSRATRILMTEEAPDGFPLNVTVYPITSQSLKIKWKPPMRENWNGQITGYHIKYRQLDSMDQFDFKTIGFKGLDTTDEILLDNLKKFTKYVITVQAQNNVGLGPSTREMIGTTLEDVPSQPPKDIKCIPSSSQSLQLSWNAPSAQYLNGILRGYRIIYKPAEEFNMKPKLEFRTTTLSEVDLKSLDKHTNYSVQVQAFTDAGDGLKSTPVYCRTKEDVPGPPANIKVLPMSSDAIIVSWIPPEDPNGYITKYTVYMRVIDDYRQSASSFTLPPSQFYYEARGLSENLQYEFWVRASTVVGEGEKTRVISNSPVSTVPARIASFSMMIIAKRKDDIKLACKAVGIPTPDREWLLSSKAVQVSSRLQILGDGSLLIASYRSPDAGNYTCRVLNIYAKDEITHSIVNKPYRSDQYPPSPPVVKVTDRTSNSLTITWTLEELDNIPIKGLSLNCKTDVEEWQEIRLEPHLTYYRLENLSCGTRYHLYMVVYNQVGGSEPSDMIMAVTLGNVPALPDRERILEVNSTFIVLHLPLWPDGGCPILHFVVEYKERDSLEWLIVADKVPRLQMVTVTDLTPQNAYNLRVVSVNEAGSTSAEYDFITERIFSELMRGEMMDDSTRSSSQLFFDLNVIVPVASAVVIVAAFLVVACICVHRNRYNEYLHTVRSVHKADPLTMTSRRVGLGGDVGVGGGVIGDKMGTSQKKVITSTDNQTYDQAYTPDQTRKAYETNKSNVNVNESQNSVHDEISPYATFQLPATRYGVDVAVGDVRFHTFGYEGGKACEYQPTAQFQYTKVRKKSSGLPYQQTNHRGERIPMSSRPTAATKEHLNPLQTASLRKQSPSSADERTTCSETTVALSASPAQRPLTPSAPPVEHESTDSEPQLCRRPRSTSRHRNKSRAARMLNRVPDILDHAADSTTSNESLDAELITTTPFPKVGRITGSVCGGQVRPCRFALRTVTTSLQDEPSSPDSGSDDDISFKLQKPATPPPGFCDHRRDDNNIIIMEKESTRSDGADKTAKSPCALAAVEEELIALLKRGATEQQQQSQCSQKDKTNNYNDINV